MTRIYTVTSLEVLPTVDDFSDVVVGINFTYGDADNFLKGFCPIPLPEGSFVPLDSVSKELAMEWLLAYCPNTTEQFDAQLDLQSVTNTSFIYDWPEPSEV